MSQTRVQSQVRLSAPTTPALDGQTGIDPALYQQDAYILGPGDRVQLTFFDPGAKALSGTFDILNDGSASFALLGSVVLSGLTLNQAQLWLQSLYARHLNRPDLNVSVLLPRPLQVSVTGEVVSPGLYTLTRLETAQVEGLAASTAGGPIQLSGLPTVVTAIQKAGGLTLNANLADVRLQRRIPGDASQVRETELNLISLLRSGDKAQNPFLFDGDTIVIGSAPAPDQEVMELAAANLSPQQISVTVVGEVVSPGRLSLAANTPVVQAVLSAGGPRNFRGRRSDVELVRINRNGSATRQLITIDYSQGVSGLRNPPLRDGDTVVVNRSNYALATDALGAVATPITGLVNIWGLLRLLQDN
ncbi:MAG: SLBB domain-containing protein [Cyanobacteriota bacterium]|nr:SLBB domain-containing protein [Cyanobacteriota bacterium]